MTDRVAFVSFLCVLCCCGGESERFRTAEVRDSAGIRIVENFGPVWRDGSEWQLASEPLTSIGRVEGDPNDQLYRVRGSLRLESGQIIVANAGTYQLRWYDKDGRYLRSAGEKGGGPGEFEALRWISRYGADSIATWDARNLRISIFGMNGGFGRSIPLRVGGTVRGTFSDGSFLLEQVIPSSDQGLVRHQAMVLRYVPAGEIVDSLGVFMGFEQIIAMEMTGSRFRVMERSRPFGREAMFAAAGTTFVAGTQDRFELQVHDINGGLISMVRLAWPSEPVTNVVIDEYKREVIAGLITGDTARVRRELDELPYPETMPAYGSILFDDVGNLWAQKYRTPGDSASAWVVFDTERRMLGTVEMPLGLEIYEIGSDYVLGLSRDEYDVEHVVLHELYKP